MFKPIVDLDAEVKELARDAISSFTQGSNEVSKNLQGFGSDAAGKLADSITSLGATISSGVSIEHKIDEKTNALMSETLKQISSHVNQVTEMGVPVNITNPFSTYMTQMKDLMATLGIPLLVVGVGATFWYIRSIKSTQAVELKTILKLLPEQVSSVLKDSIETIVLKEDIIRPQGKLEVSDSIFEVLSKAITLGIVSLSSFAAKGNIVDKIKYTFKDIPRTCDSITWVFKTLFTLIEQALDWIGSHMGFEKLLSLRSKSTAVNIWMDQVLALTNRIDVKHEQLTTLVADEFHYLVATGNSLMTKYGNDRDLGTRINKVRDMLEQHRQDFAGLNFKDNGFRINPLTINLRGTPGKGKSDFLTNFAKAMCEITMPDHLLDAFHDSPPSQVHVAQAENKYWDGYQNQWVTIFDDFLQMKDNETTMDNEVMMMIRGASDFPMHLHMSSIHDKADTYFRSRLILLSTNADSYDERYVKSINCIDALNRRIDIDAELSIFPEFATEATRNLPHGARKFDPVYKLGKTITEAWSIKISKIRDTPVAMQEMDYDEFLEYCATEFFRIQDRSELIATSHRESMTKAKGVRDKFVRA